MPAGSRPRRTSPRSSNATAGHALDFDDSAMFSSHPSNPLTAAVLAVGEKLGSSGQDLVLAFLVGWEVICQTNKPCETPAGNTLLIRGWHNQGFQPALGLRRRGFEAHAARSRPNSDGDRQRRFDDERTP